MIRPIVKFGHPVLHAPARPVAEVTDDTRRLIDDMIETMYAAPGIGLAATQIGVPLRVTVIDLSVGRRDGQLITLVNPEFVDREGMQEEEEGCLSVPGFTSPVVRPSRAVVKGLDRDGKPVQYEGDGLLARAFQHEIDHLDGIVYVDRLRGLKRDMILRRIRKLAKQEQW